MIFQKIKNPVNPGIPGFLIEFDAQKVESEGFEPSSKQAIQKLSTRLVFAWIVGKRSGQKQPNLFRILN
tara:strand:- start:276 stop:482 length:207 start_codon:yes stop_codon:yes gene_type:complete